MRASELLFAYTSRSRAVSARISVATDALLPASGQSDPGGVSRETFSPIKRLRSHSQIWLTSRCMVLSLSFSGHWLWLDSLRQ